jgi:ApeA N-terminal domain 1
LVILTDSEFRVTWPSIVIEREKEKYQFKWYFARLRSGATEPPKSHESPTNFVQLKENFGSIVSAWQRKREQFGPGFYLYLAVRRGMKFYPEHRFVNLIWGIEALHRKKYPPASPTSAELKLKAKVSRIVAQVKPARDKKWLEDRLKNAHEPSLEQRIFDVITSVPIRLDVKKIREFSKRCAELRNEISHFGAQRHGGNYTVFIHELMYKSEALSVVYHMLILHEIGIDATTLCWWIYDSHRSYREKRTLVEGGLL